MENTKKYMTLNEDNVVSGFYSSEINEIPNNALEITEELWLQLLESGQSKLINVKTSGFVITDFEKYMKPLTQEELKQQEINEIENWFNWYDLQIIQYERSLRIQTEFNHNIDDLDKQAIEKSKRLKELRD